MNQRYIDFVPVKHRPVAKPAPQPVVKPAAKPVAKPVAKPAQKPAAKPVAKPVAKPASVTPESEIKIIKSKNLTKRPLTLAKKKAVKPAVKPVAKPATKSVEAPIARPAAKPAQAKKPDTVFHPPKFINTSKIEKRPLSKTVYDRRKEFAVAKEEPSGPIAIIDKSEKDSNIGLIITVLLTIILGAAVGTIAFLLIPR